MGTCQWELVTIQFLWRVSKEQDETSISHTHHITLHYTWNVHTQADTHVLNWYIVQTSSDTRYNWNPSWPRTLSWLFPPIRSRHNHIMYVLHSHYNACGLYSNTKWFVYTYLYIYIYIAPITNTAPSQYLHSHTLHVTNARHIYTAAAAATYCTDRV